MAAIHCVGWQPSNLCERLTERIKELTRWQGIHKYLYVLKQYRLRHAMAAPIVKALGLSNYDNLHAQCTLYTGVYTGHYWQWPTHWFGLSAATWRNVTWPDITGLSRTAKLVLGRFFGCRVGDARILKFYFRLRPLIMSTDRSPSVPVVERRSLWTTDVSPTDVYQYSSGYRTGQSRKAKNCLPQRAAMADQWQTTTYF